MSTIIPLSIPPDHPVFAGHFPGNPIVPGALLLDESLRSIAAACGVTLTECGIVTAKFTSPIRPGEELQLDFACGEQACVNFTIRTPDRVVARGTFRVPGIAPSADAT